MTGRILIVDDLAINRIILRAKLGSACYDTIAASSGDQALAIARSERPDLIVLDMMMPGLDGIAVCRALRADPVTAQIPVIVATASRDVELRKAALDAGARVFLTKPLDEMVLLAHIRSLLRAHETEAELRRQSALCQDHGFSEPPAAFNGPPRVVLVGASPQLGVFWRHRLAPFYRGCRFDVMTMAEALNLRVDQPSPDVFVIGPEMAAQPGGLRVLLDLQTRKRSRRAALCVIVPSDTVEQSVMALDLGADDLLVAPLDAEETALRLRLLIERKRRTDALRGMVERGLNLAAIDPLTGLLNRRSAVPQLLRIASEAQRRGTSFAVMLLDLDRFKAVNDTFGHGVGDTVLKVIAARLRSLIGADDVLARYGGEEFLVALAQSDPDVARDTAERLCRVIEETPVTGSGIPVPLRVTMSVGLAVSRGSDAQQVDVIERMIERADRALLDAKSLGRNTVTVSQSAA